MLAAILLVWVSMAQAQECEKERAISSYTIQKGSSFWATSVEYFDGEDPRDEITVQNLNFERGYYLLKPLSLIRGIHLLSTGGHKKDREDREPKRMDVDLIGLGLAGTGRLDLVRIKGLQLFIDTGIGFLLCSDQFPPGGTFWNFTQRYVVGVSVRFLTNANLLLGVNRLHISNAGYKRNPSYDGNGAFLGVMYGF